MINPRRLLVLFALACLAMQVVSYMASISRHEEKMMKLEKQLVQFETKGTYIDLKSDPAVKIKEEKNKFKNETIGFIIKVLFISGATAFVYILMQRYRSKKE